MREIGIDYSSIKKYQEWDKIKLIEEFKKYASINEDLRESTLHKNNAALYRQIRNYFENYRVFLEELGHDYDEIRGKIDWKEEKIHKEFEKYLSEGNDIKASSINRENTTLYNAIKRKYGEYGDFLELKGIDYNDIRGIIKWTDEKVKTDYIRLSNEHGGILSFTGLALKDNKLYQQVRKRFKGYKNFLIELGLKEEEIYRIIKFEQELGLAFESLVKEMFERLNYSYDYQYRGIKGIRPDFYDSSNDRIIDVKLSFYTGFKSYTPKKYLKHCQELTLIYLRGEPFEYKIENLSVIPIDYYYDVLKENGLENLVEKFEGMKKVLN